MNPKFCRSCGSPLGENDRFCGSCGGAVVATSPAVTGQTANAPSAEAPSGQAARSEPYAEQTAAHSVGMAIPTGLAKSDRPVVLLAAVSTIGFAVLWLAQLPRLVLDHIEFRFDAAVVLTVLFFAPAGVLIPAAVVLTSRSSLRSGTTEDAVRFVALWSFMIAAVRVPAVFAGFMYPRSDRNWSMNIWTDYIRMLSPDWYEWPIRLVSITVVAGLVSFVLFAVNRRIWTMVPYIRPGGLLIGLSVAYWVLCNVDASRRFNNLGLVLFVGAALAVVAAFMLLLPGDFGPDVALFTLILHGSFVVAALLGRTFASVFLGRYGIADYLTWSASIGQAVRSGLIAGVSWFVLSRSGGVRQHIQRVRALALGN